MTAEPWVPEPPEPPLDCGDPDPDRREPQGEWYPEWDGPDADPCARSSRAVVVTDAETS